MSTVENPVNEAVHTNYISYDSITREVENDLKGNWPALREAFNCDDPKIQKAVKYLEENPGIVSGVTTYDVGVSYYTLSFDLPFSNLRDNVGVLYSVEGALRNSYE